jgi:hypothetical protein
MQLYIKGLGPGLNMGVVLYFLYVCWDLLKEAAWLAAGKTFWFDYQRLKEESFLIYLGFVKETIVADSCTSYVNLFWYHWIHRHYVICPGTLFAGG